MGSVVVHRVGWLYRRAFVQKPMVRFVAGQFAGPVASAPCCASLFSAKGVLVMTTVIAAYLGAWVVGYVLGFKVRMIKMATYAA